MSVFICCTCNSYLQLRDDARFDLCKHVIHAWMVAQQLAPEETLTVPNLLHDLVYVAAFSGSATSETFRRGLRSPSLAQTMVQKRFLEYQECEERRRAQAKLDAVEGTDNAMWYLHMLLAGMPVPGDQDAVSRAAKQLLLSHFGWTLSFSRALHSGVPALRNWFEAAGINVAEVQDQYQCASQEAEAFRMVGSGVEDSSFPGVWNVICEYVAVNEDEQDFAESSPMVSTVAQATSLLMYAPVFDNSGNKEVVVETPLVLDGEMVTLPCVKAQLYSSTPEMVPERRHVYRMPFLLTPPRIQLVMQLAECMARHGTGASLTGVHGTGKSMFLKAFSTILPAGFPCDMLHIGNASDLWAEPQLAWQQLAQGSGHLVDGRAKGADVVPEMSTIVESLEENQRIVQAQWRLGAAKPTTSWSKLQTLVGNVSQLGTQNYSHASFCARVLAEAQKESYNSAYGRVVILDEVNQLLRLLAEQHQQLLSFFKVQGKQPTAAAPEGPSQSGAPQPKPKKEKEEGQTPEKGASPPTGPASAFWNNWLPWNRDPGTRSFRILASAPDGTREKRPDRKYEVFYELRPTRFDHLAAILYAAPDFLLPSHGMSKEITMSNAALVRAQEVCQALCGNLRYTTQYFKSFAAQVRSAAAASDGGGLTHGRVRDIHVACLHASQLECSESLAQRMRRAYEDPSIFRPRGPAEGAADIQYGDRSLFGLVAKNASMIVRTNARLSGSACDVVGSVSIAALRKYLASRSTEASDAPEDQAAAGLFLKKWSDKMGGAALEDLVQSRLALLALAARAWRLDQLHRISESNALPAAQAAGQPRRDFLRLCEAHKHWEPEQPMAANAAARANLEDALHQSPAWWVPARMWAAIKNPPFVWQVRQSATNASSRVDPDVGHSINACLQHGGILLIRTADQKSPGVHFILLRVPRGAGACSVTFVKVTKRSLRSHGRSRDFDVPDALMDIAAVTVPVCTVAQHVDGTWMRTKKAAGSLDQGWSVSAESSILNFWLRQLGCLKRVRAHMHVPKDRHLTLNLEAAHEADCTPNTITGREWDVSLVYVSTSDKLVEQPGEYGFLHADFVYGVFRPDFDDALDAWARVPALPGRGGASSSGHSAVPGGQQ